MSYLHHVLEQRGLFAPEDLSDAAARQAWQFVRRIGPSAMCFDMGPIESYDSLKTTSDLGIDVRWPYTACWFEGNVINELGGRSEFGVLIHSDEAKDYFKAALFMKWDRLFYPVAITTHTDLKSFEQKSLDPLIWTVGDEGLNEFSFAMENVSKFCAAMSCVNVRRTEHRPSEKLQKARARRGKVPLFSFWTLDLTPHQESAQLGGTHASPRLHLRRGHIRQFQPGRYCWVQPHAVGNKTLGIVHKDYRVTPELLTEAQRRFAR